MLLWRSGSRKIYAISTIHWRLDDRLTEVNLDSVCYNSFSPSVFVGWTASTILGRLKLMLVSVVLRIGRLRSRGSFSLDCCVSWWCSIWVITMCFEIAMFQYRSWFYLVFWSLDPSRDCAFFRYFVQSQGSCVWGWRHTLVIQSRGGKLYGGVVKPSQTSRGKRFGLEEKSLYVLEWKSSYV